MAVAEREHAAMEVVDLETTPLRELNQRLHDLADGRPGPRRWRIVNPSGAHVVACGLDADIEVEIEGHVGYYCAGMNKLATVRIHGNASTGIAENMMSGRVEVEGNVSQSAGATGRGGLLVVRGNASSRCGPETSSRSDAVQDCWRSGSCLIARSTGARISPPSRSPGSRSCRAQSPAGTRSRSAIRRRRISPASPESSTSW